MLSQVHSASSTAGPFSCNFIPRIKHSCINNTKIVCLVAKRPSKGAVLEDRTTGRGGGKKLCLFFFTCLPVLFLLTSLGREKGEKVGRPWKGCCEQWLAGSVGSWGRRNRSWWRRSSEAECAGEAPGGWFCGRAAGVRLGLELTARQRLREALRWDWGQWGCCSMSEKGSYGSRRWDWCGESANMDQGWPLRGERGLCFSRKRCSRTWRENEHHKQTSVFFLIGILRERKDALLPQHWLPETSETHSLVWPFLPVGRSCICIECQQSLLHYSSNWREQHGVYWAINVQLAHYLPVKCQTDDPGTPLFYSSHSRGEKPNQPGDLSPPKRSEIPVLEISCSTSRTDVYFIL